MDSLVSIITPSYNKDKYISETINSVLNQTYPNWELIIIDDVSTDSTLNIINTFKEKDSRIKLYINSENKGANFCRNYGIQQSKGEYIIFLDADDLLSTNCLENRLAKIENTNLDFCVLTMGTFYKKIGDNKNIWRPVSRMPLNDFLQHVLPWQTMQPIWKKTVIESVNGFDVNFERLQDVDFHTRILLINDLKFKCFNNETDCYYRIDEKRKNFTNFIFLERSVNSAIRYYSKFYVVSKKIGLNNYLLGTISKFYIQVLLSYKNGYISKKEFEFLEKAVLNKKKVKDLLGSKKIYFKMSKWFNLFSFRIKGVNWILNKLILSKYL